MATAIEQINSADDAICRNIDLLSDNRALLSQNVLAQLRNLTEGLAVLLHDGSVNAEFSYDRVRPALAFVASRPELNVIRRLHDLVQVSASHYTLDGDTSERLMLKYFEFLLRLRTLAVDHCALPLLRNLESFPIDLDPSLHDYHRKIAARIRTYQHQAAEKPNRDRYYIHSTRPFFVDGQIFYEVTFCRAVNRVSKFDRIIGFTRVDINERYSAMLELHSDTIEVFGQQMPISIITDWEVSIRPCEFDNFARLFGLRSNVRSSSAEYRHLMQRLTARSGSLLDILALGERSYLALKAAAVPPGVHSQIFPSLDAARLLVSGAPGRNTIRYLLVNMRNQVLKLQYSPEPCRALSGLRLKYACIPFDAMPLCTSLPGHNPRYRDVAESMVDHDRAHELLARRVRNNVERYSKLYTSCQELDTFGDVTELVGKYNAALYRKHTERQIEIDHDYVFIRGYEDDTVAIIEHLRRYAATGISGYTEAVERWLANSPHSIDDPAKRDALGKLFSNSRVAVVYGAAGTGKSTMVDHIASYFNGPTKLFLANTHPALDNLRRKVSAQNSTFRTIASHLYSSSRSFKVDVLVIDECSTVSNSDLLKVLTSTRFRLLVLVGDVHQIESIQFGNWFGIIPSFLPATSVFELTTPFRTKNEALLEFWGKVRRVDDDIAEVLSRHGYSRVLDESFLAGRGDDEIILCLNYDGLYGINNINRFLQSSNPSRPVSWGASVYKVGDPVLFSDTQRFRPLIYNNLKGAIVAMKSRQGSIQFDVRLDRDVSEFDADSAELEYLGDSTVRFSVAEYGSSDEDDDSLLTVIPFQVAYAVSIHKAQGLEYDSVKVVITDANEDDVSHSIFYTAVTRARQRLRIFWTPETQHSVLNGLRRADNPEDVAVLTARRGLTQWSS